MKKIIDEVQDLMKLPEDELTELLLEEKYNKAILRELVRRTLKVANDYKKAFEYEHSKNEELEERIENTISRFKAYRSQKE